MLAPDRLWAIGVAAAGLLALPPLVDRLLRRIGMVRNNFQGTPIPVGYGLVIALWAAPAFAYILWRMAPLRTEAAAYLACVGGFAALGFADDRWGDRSATGLRGHFKSFFVRGVITTGFVKAVGGVALAFGVCRWLLGQSLPDCALNTFLIALSANAMNLLDLRPGRACAAFLLAAAALLGWRLATGHAAGTPLLAFVFIPALAAYERDARAAAMMGDTGSNPLGAALGITLAIHAANPVARAAVLAALVLLHLAAERISLSRLIESHPLLRRIDALTGKR